MMHISFRCFFSLYAVIFRAENNNENEMLLVRIQFQFGQPCHNRGAIIAE